MTTKPRFWTSLHGVATITLVGGALYFLLMEHREHTLPYLPYLVILLCPLMHLFMHKGHGGHSHGADSSREAEETYRRGLKEGGKHSNKNP